MQNYTRWTRFTVMEITIIILLIQVKGLRPFKMVTLNTAVTLLQCVILWKSFVKFTVTLS